MKTLQASHSIWDSSTGDTEVMPGMSEANFVAYNYRWAIKQERTALFVPSHVVTLPLVRKLLTWQLCLPKFPSALIHFNSQSELLAPLHFSFLAIILLYSKTEGFNCAVSSEKHAFWVQLHTVELYRKSQSKTILQETKYTQDEKYPANNKF